MSSICMYCVETLLKTNHCMEVVSCKTCSWNSSECETKIGGYHPLSAVTQLY